MSVFMCRGTPLTRSVWLHGNGSGGVWEQVDRVARRALPLEGVALEIDAVDVHLCAEPEGEPRNRVPGTHLQARKVPIHETVDG